MKKFKKALSLSLVSAMILGNITPIFASVDELQATNKDETLATDVYFNQDSTFTVTVPKKVTLENDKTSTYEVTVEGDISSDNIVYVVPEEEFEMKDIATTGVAKAPVKTTVEQSKTKWRFNEFDQKGNGEISAPTISAGNWRGTFWFNISLKTNFIDVTAKDENGNDLNASSSLITGTQKEELLDSLVESGLVDSKEDIDAIIDVESDDFDGLADTEFDVSNIAKPGDKVTILHYDETKGEWEYIGTEIVDENGKIKGDFSSYSPIVFVKQDENGNLEHVHNYKETIVDSTCIAEGSKTYTCGCGDTYTNTTSALGHDFSSEFTIDKAATCIETGSKSKHCSRCDEKTEITTIAIIDHNYVNDVCTMCGDSKKLVAGLYDSKGNLLCTWAASGISLTRSWGTTQEARKSSLSAYNIIGTKYPSTTKVVLPEGSTTIAKYVFTECLTIKDVVIPEGVTSIADGAFYLCNNFNGSIVIPTTLKSVGKYAFYGASPKVYYRGTSAQWNSISITSDGNSDFKNASKVYNYVD